MRAGPIVSVVTALLSGTTLADFYIYEGWSTYSTGLDPTTEFYFFPGPPDCDDVNTGYTPYSPSDDVSGDKTGVRCDGCNAYGDSIAPTELEFNTDLGHYSKLGSFA
ncbi:hypothetical protein SLS60_001669 [Paraconiothyrium brasiliense]|uniref:Uncharacterized protein n=1 Tax=Paraconiothyrium brasiliense TaxID=300254 RepID=A0ABR3S0Y7_9PLEO